MKKETQDRGMMKYMPYQSLVEQATYLAKMRYQRNKTPKPLVASDQAEEINEILVHYQGEDVQATYWEDGYLHAFRGVIRRIDAFGRFLLFGEKRVAFTNLIRLCRT